MDDERLSEAEYLLAILTEFFLVSAMKTTCTLHEKGRFGPPSVQFHCETEKGVIP